MTERGEFQLREMILIWRHIYFWTSRVREKAELTSFRRFRPSVKKMRYDGIKMGLAPLSSTMANRKIPAGIFPHA